MIFKNKKKAKLSIMLFFAASTVTHAQYNVDYKMGNYSDPQTIESNVDIGGDQIITVGTLTVSEFAGTHKDIILTRLDDAGGVIWNFRYGSSGYDEVGNGVTLSWDKKHIIVVGSITKPSDVIDPAVIERQALVMKVRISDGAVIWNTYHGIDRWDDQAFLVKRSNGFEDNNYIVVGESQGDTEQSFTRMYAFKVDESGNELWSKRYYLSYNLPITAMHPTSMVEDGFNEFMIAGTRVEVDRPNQIFTVGIKSDNGDLSKDLHHYPIEVIYSVKTVDIDRHPDGKGYGISFTAEDFRGACLGGVADADVDRIGVIRLNEDRRVNWAKVYWEKDATNHNGLSIRFYKDELQVCVNINRDILFNTPGLLRVSEVDGSVIFCNTYHIPVAHTDYGPVANHMIRSSRDQYYIKSLYRGGGFSMVNTDVAGRAYCDLEARIEECRFKTEPVEEKCEGKDYGRYDFYRIRRYVSDYSINECIDRLAPESIEGGIGTNGSLPINKVLVYPSPVTEGQDIVNIKFITDSEVGQGNVKIINSMGQVVVNSDIVFITGENKFAFDTKQFSTGLYVVMVTVDGELMDQVKFVKN